MTQRRCPCCPQTVQPKDLRHAIATVFIDLADQAARKGDYFVSSIWDQAASIAGAFVEKPGTTPRPETC